MWENDTDIFFLIKFYRCFTFLAKFLNKNVLHPLKLYYHHRYSEVCQYDFDNPSFKQNTGHFTQVDWADTTDIGVGVAFGTNKNGMDCVYLVGRYKPAGNIEVAGEFQKNIKLGSFERMYYCTPEVLADENVWRNCWSNWSSVEGCEEYNMCIVKFNL